MVSDSLTLGEDGRFDQSRVYVSSHPMFDYDVIRRVVIHGTYQAAAKRPGTLEVKLAYPPDPEHWSIPHGAVSAELTKDDLTVFWRSIFSISGEPSYWRYDRR